MNRARSILALALALSIAPLAHADVSDAPLTQLVQFGDLDVSRAEGAQVLYSRLRLASRNVCAPLESRDLKRVAAYRECVQQALATAVAQADQPLLTQYYRAVGGDRTAPVAIASRD